jgi:hypothetical protein
MASDLKSPQYGGGGGNAFDDSGYIGNPITSITVRHGEYVDSIQVTYSGQQAPQHGGDGGQADTISLAKGEQVIAVVGRSGDLVDQIQFVTVSPGNVLRNYGPYGGTGGSPFYIIGAVDAFFGSSGEYLDAVGVWVQPPVSVSA